MYFYITVGKRQKLNQFTELHNCCNLFHFSPVCMSATNSSQALQPCPHCRTQPFVLLLNVYQYSTCCVSKLQQKPHYTPSGESMVLEIRKDNAYTHTNTHTHMFTNDIKYILQIIKAVKLILLLLILQKLKQIMKLGKLGEHGDKK